MSQINTENDKEPKFSIFKVFMHFVEVSTGFVDWNVLRVNKENVYCPEDFYDEIIAMI